MTTRHSELGLALRSEGQYFELLRTYDHYPGDLCELLNAGGG
jgi:hypothetical protein